MAKLKESQRGEWETRVKRVIESKIFKPGIGRVLVARDPRREKLGDSIYQADAYSEQEQMGTVVALGHRRENAMGSKVDFCYRLGQRVMINQMAGKGLTLFGLEMALLEEEEVLLAIEE